MGVGFHDFGLAVIDVFLQPFDARCDHGVDLLDGLLERLPINCRYVVVGFYGQILIGNGAAKKMILIGFRLLCLCVGASTGGPFP